MSSVCLSRVCYSTKEIERKKREGEGEMERERGREKERENFIDYKTAILLSMVCHVLY